MKNIVLVLLSLPLAACASTPDKTSELKQTESTAPSRETCYIGSIGVYNQLGVPKSGGRVVVKADQSARQLRLTYGIDFAKMPISNGYTIDGERIVNTDRTGSNAEGAYQKADGQVRFRIDEVTADGTNKLKRYQFDNTWFHAIEQSGDTYVVTTAHAIERDCQEAIQISVKRAQLSQTRSPIALIEEAEKSDASGNVKLNFGWPDGTTTFHAEILKSKDGKSNVGYFVTDVTIKKDGEGYTKSIENGFGLFVPNDLPEGLKITLSNSGVGGVLNLGADGSALSIANEDIYLAALKKTLRQRKIHLPDDDPTVVATQKMGGSAAMQLGALSRDWSFMTSFWSGGEIEFGTVFEQEETMPLDIGYGRSEVTMKTQYQAMGTVKCRPEDAEAKCLLLSYDNRLDPESLMNAVAKVLPKDSPKHEETLKMFEEQIAPKMKIHRQALIVAEPSTLRTFEYHYTSVVETPDGKGGVSTQRDVKSMTVHHDR